MKLIICRIGIYLSLSILPLLTIMMAASVCETFIEMFIVSLVSIGMWAILCHRYDVVLINNN